MGTIEIGFLCKVVYDCFSFCSDKFLALYDELKCKISLDLSKGFYAGFGTLSMNFAMAPSRHF